MQACLEQALSRVANAPVVVHGAGRTDTGVHATGQVVHFDPPVHRPLRSWLLGANSHLPPAAAVVWVHPVPAEFHARFSAISRRYRYRILNRWPRPAFDRGRWTWIHEPLDVARMHDAAQHLVGEHDFTSFRARACQASHPVRRVLEVDVSRCDDRISVIIEGNAFLHHMVRNIVGSLLLVGRGEQPPQWIAQVLRARDRDLAGPTAPATGLCLERVSYPGNFALPSDPASAPRGVP